MDRISNHPLSVIEIILCLLPIQEAIRTSVLSREWRYCWIKIPTLVFEEVAFQVSTDGAESSVVEQTFEQTVDQRTKRKKLTKRRNFFHAIWQVLLMHEAPLHEFTLSMLPDDLCYIDDKCVELDSIIFHLSRKNTVKKLRIDFEFGGYKLPLSLFSFRHLTDICLSGCRFNREPTFNGFVSVTSLSLDSVYITKRKLLHLLSNCPLLKTPNLVIDSCYILVNSDNPTIINLFECSPVIKSMSIPFGIFQFVTVPQGFPTALIHLRYLYIDQVCFTQNHKDGLSVLVLLMKSSPNLEKIKIDNTGLEEDDSSTEDDPFAEDDICSFTLNIWLEHMNELHIISFKNWGNELNFVKLILAKSPLLKKVRIYLDYRTFDEDEELQNLKTLLCSLFDGLKPVMAIHGGFVDWFVK